MSVSDGHYTALADLVLGLHVVIVVFVVGGLLAVLVGAPRGWAWVRGRGFRWLHLAAIAVVVAEAWLGVICPLTTLEMWLRAQAGQAGHAESFIGYWLQRLLYIDAPPEAFIAAYSLFFLGVLWAWWRWPPLGRRP